MGSGIVYSVFEKRDNIYMYMYECIKILYMQLTCNPCSNGSVVECMGVSLSSVQSHIETICGIVIRSVAIYLESYDTATAITPCPSSSKNVRTGTLQNE